MPSIDTSSTRVSVTSSSVPDVADAAAPAACAWLFGSIGLPSCWLGLDRLQLTRQNMASSAEMEGWGVVWCNLG